MTLIKRSWFLIVAFMVGFVLLICATNAFAFQSTVKVQSGVNSITIVPSPTTQSDDTEEPVEVVSEDTSITETVSEEVAFTDAITSEETVSEETTNEVQESTIEIEPVQEISEDIADTGTITDTTPIETTTNIETPETISKNETVEIID